MTVGLFFMLLLNFGISWFNAWSVGRAWSDSKVVAGWPRLVTWCGAVMAAVGFSWCCLTIAALGLGAVGYLPVKWVQATMELGYVVIVFPMLGSGLGIWIHSLLVAWRNRDVLSVGIAAWNTYTQVHNTYQSATLLPSVFDNLTNVFSWDTDEDGVSSKFATVSIALVVFALLSGILLTVAIVRKSAKDYSRRLLSGIGFEGSNIGK